MSDVRQLMNTRGQVLLELDGNVIRTPSGQELGTILGNHFLNLRGQRIGQFNEKGVQELNGMTSLKVDGLNLVGPAGDRVAYACSGTPFEVAALGAAYLAYFAL